MRNTWILFTATLVAFSITSSAWAQLGLFSREQRVMFTPEWKGEVGFVPQVVERLAPPAANAVAIVCGPPIMIKLTMPVLAKLGFTGDQIYTTLENRMKCGVGKCGRCNAGPVYICKEGPVFTLEQIRQLPEDY